MGRSFIVVFVCGQTGDTRMRTDSKPEGDVVKHHVFIPCCLVRKSEIQDTKLDDYMPIREQVL